MVRKSLLLVIALLAPFVISTATHAAGLPVVLGAGVDAAGGSLRIEGANFGPNPAVTLGTTPLDVKSSTATEIVTNFTTSGFLPGTYVLRVEFGQGPSAFFALSIPATTASAQAACGTTPLLVNILSSAPSALVGALVTVSAIVLDPDAQICDGPFSFEWKLLGVPASSRAVLVPSSGAASSSFVPDLPGTYVITVVVSRTGRTTQAFFTFVVS
jgi:hypothetical protein